MKFSRKAGLLLFIVSIFTLAPAAFGVSYIVPPDEQLIARAEVIASGTVERTEGRVGLGRGIETVVTISVDRLLKGNLRERGTLELIELGGSVNGRFMVIPGAQTYQTGERVLVFAIRDRSGQLTTLDFALGKFTFVETGGRPALTREAGETEVFGWDASGARHTEQARDAEQFLSFISDRINGIKTDRTYAAPSSVTAPQPSIERNAKLTPLAFPPSNYVLTFQPGAFTRWKRFDAGQNILFVRSRSQTGIADSTAAFNRAINAWSGDGNSNVDVRLSGTECVPNADPSNCFIYPFGASGGDDGKNSIVFDVASGDMPTSGNTESNAVGYSILYGDGAFHTFKGETFADVIETDIFIRAANGLSGNAFDQLLTHEVGHSIGFRHSNSGQTPSASSAVMSSNISGSFGASLQLWDRDAVQTVYGPGPACTAPTISTQPQNKTITSGTQTTLSVVGAGSAPLSYQWYRGNSPDNSNPVTGATSTNFQTPVLTATTSYWVKVINSCGFALSNTAVVTVNPCTSPSITSQPQSATVAPGATATLSVNASGTAPLTYRWYEGSSGDISTPVNGATASTFTTPPVTGSRNFWVKVTNSCGSANSTTATVSNSCVSPAITQQPQSASVNSGSTQTLSVGATGSTLSYQWFQGPSGDMSSPVGGATSASFTTPPVTSAVSYWVRITNACGNLNSAAAVLTLGCIPPTASVQPQNTVVVSGTPVNFNAAPGGTEPFTYQWYRGSSGDESSPIAGATGSSYTQTATAPFSVWVKVTNACGSAASGTATVALGCSQVTQPVVSVVAEALSGQTYQVNFESNFASQYEVQESTSPEFTNPTTQTTSARVLNFTHSVTTPTRYYYRARATSSCDSSTSAFSRTADIAIVLPPPSTATDPNINVPENNRVPVTFQIFVPGTSASGKLTLDVSFVASTDRSWVTVSPSSGSIPSTGTTLTVTATTADLNVGTNTATVNVTNPVTNTSIVSVPVSVSLVPPVASLPKNPPTSETMVIPAVAHASGANNSQFQSDVRITNVGAQTRRYEVTFTPSGTNGTLAGKTSVMTIPPGQTTAMNDIVKNLYGLGSAGESALGMLQIRPVPIGKSFGSFDPLAVSLVSTVASSRTYNNTAAGTFGQYIPAVQFSSFVNRALGTRGKMSLQQLSQSTNYRTNFGLVEGSGQPATVQVKVFDQTGALRGTYTETLEAAQHKQFSEYMKNKGLPSIENARIEVEVLSETGSVTAYASVVDNRTNDPLLVSPSVVANVSANKFVIPGVADLNTGTASWRSDVAILNGGTSDVNATLTFYPQDSSPAKTSQVVLKANQVTVLNGVLQSQFGVTNMGGALHISSSANSKLVATARTYDNRPPSAELPNGGTYGQFIPAVTADESIGAADRALEILQLEESERFRSNLGIAEVTGNSAIIEISAIVPESRVAFKLPSIQLQGNQFLNYGKILKAFNIGTAYNARISIKVIGGNGKVTAYASVVDNRTQDPTYVPAQ